MVALSLLYWSIFLCFRYFDLFRTLSYNFHPASTNFPSSIPLIFFKLSTQHQLAIIRNENWAILSTQGLQFSYTLIRAFSKISAYTKTVQFYSTKNTSMNKFLAQSSSPYLMLGAIPPASLSEGWTLWPVAFKWVSSLSVTFDKVQTSQCGDFFSWCVGIQYCLLFIRVIFRFYLITKRNIETTKVISRCIPLFLTK